MHRLEDLDVHLFLVGEVKLTSIGGEGGSNPSHLLFICLFIYFYNGGRGLGMPLGQEAFGT